MKKLTWKEIKAHPKKALRVMRMIQERSAAAWQAYEDADAKFRQVRDKLHDQADLLSQITRLQSEVYDLKKRQNLPR